MRANINRRPVNTSRVGTSHGLWCLTGVVVGVVWTAVGWGIAILQGVPQTFLQEWSHLQGFFLTALGTWLLMVIRSGTFRARVGSLTANGGVGVGGRRLQATVISSVGIIGTVSLIALGFPAQGPLLGFMWITCAAVCFTAGAATYHTIEIIAAVHGLLRSNIKVFRYAPATTPQLRDVVSYFSSYTLLVTVGYAFALTATLSPHWTGPKDYVDAVRLFWPIIYVPTCSVALIYPHLVVHRLIQREKEKTLLSCERDIDNLLTRYGDLKKEDIDRTNTLAQLFNRIAGTPNYVVDLGIAVRTVIPLVFNLLTLLLKTPLIRHS